MHCTNKLSNWFILFHHNRWRMLKAPPLISRTYYDNVGPKLKNPRFVIESLFLGVLKEDLFYFFSKIIFRKFLSSLFSWALGFDQVVGEQLDSMVFDMSPVPHDVLRHLPDIGLSNPYPTNNVGHPWRIIVSEVDFVMGAYSIIVELFYQAYASLDLNLGLELFPTYFPTYYPASVGSKRNKRGCF